MWHFDLTTDSAFLPNVKYFEVKIRIQFNNTPPKIVNVYIIYDLDNWPKNPLRNFTLKDCLFGATNIVKNSDKEKYVYNGYGMAFDGKGEWSFGNDFAKNVKLFGVYNSSSSHTGNLENDFLILGDGPTFVINESFGASKKKWY